MGATTDRTWREVADRFEAWRDRTGELAGCGAWEAAWRRRGGRALVVAGLRECRLVPARSGPVAALPATLGRSGEAGRERAFRELCARLDRQRAEDPGPARSGP
jgi:hypothetical protein